jgi:hypothetical protein
LNRESRAKEKYEAARLKLLGLDDESAELGNPDENPFK